MREPTSQLECDKCSKKLPVYIYEGDLQGSYFYCEDCSKPYVEKIKERESCV